MFKMVRLFYPGSCICAFPFSRLFFVKENKCQTIT